MEWNIPFFTSRKYFYYCTHKHSLFVYYKLRSYGSGRLLYWLKHPKHNRNSMKRRFNLMKEQWSGISIVISTEINILNYLCQSDVLDIVLWDFDGTRLPWLNESGRLWFPVSAHRPIRKIFVSPFYSELVNFIQESSQSRLTVLQSSCI